MNADHEAAMPESVVPYLAVNGGAAALEFYTRAFAARETFRLRNDDGTLGHAEFFIGRAKFFLADEWPVMGVKSPLTLGGYSVSLAITVDDADSFVLRLADEGATIERPVSDGPEPGTRAGWVIDPFGHRWHISSRLADRSADIPERLPV
jgi:PhnB protein